MRESEVVHSDECVGVREKKQDMQYVGESGKNVED